MNKNLELVDIHAHVNFDAFEDDRESVMQRSHDASVGMILVGTEHATSLGALEQAKHYQDGVWAASGLHPTLARSGFEYEKYKTLAANKKVVAIGECGIDYFRSGKTQEEKTLQYKVFRAHIHLAREVKKPLIIHCRNAYDDLVQILKEEKADEIGGTIHFFVGSWADAQKFLDIGFHLSFTGVITFARDYDETLKNAPLDRIMVETDAPYVAPLAYRGKRNEPLYVREVAKKIAELRGISYEEVARETTKNATKLFRLS